MMKIKDKIDQGPGLGSEPSITRQIPDASPEYVIWDQDPEETS